MKNSGLDYSLICLALFPEKTVYKEPCFKRISEVVCILTLFSKLTGLICDGFPVLSYFAAATLPDSKNIFFVLPLYKSHSV